MVLHDGSPPAFPRGFFTGILTTVLRGRSHQGSSLEFPRRVVPSSPRRLDTMVPAQLETWTWDCRTAGSEVKKMFEVTHRDGAARRGLLSTPHGVVETPVFMPVGTQGVVKAMT